MTAQPPGRQRNAQHAELSPCTELCSEQQQWECADPHRPLTCKAYRLYEALRPRSVWAKAERKPS